MILWLATANENGRGTGVPPVKSEDQTSMLRLDSLVRALKPARYCCAKISGPP